MQAQFFSTPKGFGFKFPEFVLPKQVIEVPFPRYVQLGLRTVLCLSITIGLKELVFRLYELLRLLVDYPSTLYWEI